MTRDDAGEFRALIRALRIERPVFAHQRRRPNSLFSRVKSPPPARVDFGEDFPDERDESNWERLYVRARAEAVCGLVHDAIRRLGVAAPKSVVAKFEAARARTVAANRYLFRHLERMAATFQSEGLDFMVLKGAALLLRCYEDAGLRSMCDIDLLIRPREAAPADRILHGLGYRRGKSLLRKDFYPRYYYEAEYLYDGPRPIRLDVHVRPWLPSRYIHIVPQDAFRHSPIRVPLGATTVMLPNDADMLAHLLCHFAFHGGDGLRWSFDIHRFATRCARHIDWRRWADQLIDWRLSHAAMFAVDRVEATFGQCIPPAARSMLCKAGASWRDRAALRQAPCGARSPLIHAMVELLCTPSWRFKFGYLAAVLWPDADHLGPKKGEWGHRSLLWRRIRRVLPVPPGRPPDR